jgi:hypothetical protein
MSGCWVHDGHSSGRQGPFILYSEHACLYKWPDHQRRHRRQVCLTVADACFLDAVCFFFHLILDLSLKIDVLLVTAVILLLLAHDVVGVTMQL